MPVVWLSVQGFQKDIKQSQKISILLYIKWSIFFHYQAMHKQHGTFAPHKTKWLCDRNGLSWYNISPGLFFEIGKNQGILVILSVVW